MAVVNPVLWETKVLQSKATEDFFRNSLQSPLFTLQLPHGLHQTLQTSAASLVIPAGRTIPNFTTAELGTSDSSANLTFPSTIGYPIHVPAGVTLQTASGHLYKVNVPVIVTQTPGRASAPQHPLQQLFQPFGPAPVIQTSVPRLSPSALQATTEKSQRLETVCPQPTILHSGIADRKHLGNVTTDIFVPPGNEHRIMSEALLSQQESPQYISLPGVVFAPQISQIDANVEPALGVSTSTPSNLHGGPFATGPQGALHQHTPSAQCRVLQDRMDGCDSVKEPRHREEPISLPVSKKQSNSQVDLHIPAIDDDINEIIQIDGTGDTSSSEEVASPRDVDEADFPGITDGEDLKSREEEGDSISNEGSTVDSSGDEEPRRDIIEEDPLNSGDDVSEQDVPDLFDTDNVIVCQYDKIHRNKNKWKFYLKDGVMCFGGKDYVFAKAIGDAEW
ncbi:TFIIA-alpha and beta-like factor isoform X2 [Tenrec ecaudatus]|uniref:TFIIA-alpha and beta-like factor isoform X2 n=1 Tax=Tenrec ecaudatus TaxID=94439 RepID=UPI003F59E4E8